MAPALFVKAFRHGQYLGLTPAPPREEGAMPMFMVEATVTDEEGNVVHSQTIEAGDEYGGSGTLVQALERVGADGNAKMTAMMEAAGERGTSLFATSPGSALSLLSYSCKCTVSAAPLFLLALLSYV